MRDRRAAGARQVREGRRQAGDRRATGGRQADDRRATQAEMPFTATIIIIHFARWFECSSNWIGLAHVNTLSRTLYYTCVSTVRGCERNSCGFDDGRDRRSRQYLGTGQRSE